MHVIEKLAVSYPQLTLPIEAGFRTTEEYRDVILRGEPSRRRPEFTFSPEDRLEETETPVGSVEVLSLTEREDFIHAYRALAHKCEPVEIPDSVGAGIVSGLICWGRIRRHEEEYRAAGGADWDEEFAAFTADKKNYTGTVILLSSGPYSAVPAGELGLTEEEWKKASYAIRKNHELTHFICRRLYPKNIDAIRDEVVADMIGLLSAFGTYDARYARRFLGIDVLPMREGGRLAYYSAPERLAEDIRRAGELIDHYSRAIRDTEGTVFERLMALCRKEHWENTNLLF